MNVAFFLLPKDDVAYINADATMRQALEKMEHHYYTAMPIIDEDGKYVATITEGDLLWKLKNTEGLTFADTNKVPISDIKKHVKNAVVSINAQMEDLISLAVEQNFVPVVDDSHVFIGIVRRKDIISYCTKSWTSEKKEEHTHQ